MTAKANRSTEELEMRGLIVPKLRERWPSARIIHELPLRYSSNRIDLAAVTQDQIISIEIKSSRDTTQRLEAQLRAFVPISTRVIVALAPTWNQALPQREEKIRGGTRYSQQYTPAQQIILDSAGGTSETWTVCTDTGTVKTPHGGWVHRPARPWVARMLDMLWNDELLAIAWRHSIAAGKRPNHEVLVDLCTQMLTGRDAIRAVCRALRERAAFAAESDPPILTEPRAP